MYADVELRTAIFRRAFDKVHVAEDMGHTVSSNPARPDPEPGDPRWFAARDAVLATTLTSNVDPAGRRVLQHDMQDEDRILHAVPARRWPFGMIRRQQATACTLKGTATLKGTMVHHP